jgi:sugar phosphate permease
VILAAGTLAQASFTTVSVGLPALAPQLRDGYRLSLGQTGVVLAAVGIGMLFTLLPWGLVADRFGERAVIVVGLAGAAGALAATGTTRSYGGLIAWLVVAGAFGASVNAASGRVVMGWFGAQERGLALGIRQTAIPIGGFAAALLLPQLAAGGDTRRAFIALAAISAAGAVIAGFFVREPPREPAPMHAADLRGPLRDRRMWLLGTGSSLYLVAQLALTVFVVLFLHEHRHVSSTRAAAVLAAINVLGIGARIGAGRWSDHLQKRLEPLRLIGLVLTVTMVLVTALVDAPLAVLVPVLIVTGVVSITWNGLSFTASAETAGLARSGAALGFQQTLLGVVGAIFAPAFAWIVDATSWRTAFALSTLGPLLGWLTLRGLPEPSSTPATRPSDARSPETSAIPPAAR